MTAAVVICDLLHVVLNARKWDFIEYQSVLQLTRSGSIANKTCFGRDLFFGHLQKNKSDCKGQILNIVMGLVK